MPNLFCNEIEFPVIDAMSKEYYKIVKFKGLIILL